jgi:hypothetical protein
METCDPAELASSIDAIIEAIQEFYFHDSRGDCNATRKSIDKKWQGSLFCNFRLALSEVFD